MKLKHVHKRNIRNSLFRVVNELDGKMYPLGIKEEAKYVKDLYSALNHKYSKVEIANMLRRIMSYVILTNSPILATVSLARKIVNTISEKEMAIVADYIISNNQFIAKTNHALAKNNSEKNFK